ncbi:MAG: hypothetical protein CMN18_02775 [Roseovarius sp.]|nr:hypothetical protein [Roseovarius sp.]MBD11616.1 hypothetical protein [Roseovarius sp.]|tara:strand:- start:288 stop:542 length:255 start_codon:yes stop_codon:yes gene_type:complete
MPAARTTERPMTIEAQIQQATATIASLASEVRALRELIAPPSDMLTVAEAAKRLGVSQDTIRRKVRSGELKTNGMTGKAKRVKV